MGKKYKETGVKKRATGVSGVTEMVVPIDGGRTSSALSSQVSELSFDEELERLKKTKDLAYLLNAHEDAKQDIATLALKNFERAVESIEKVEEEEGVLARRFVEESRNILEQGLSLLSSAGLEEEEDVEGGELVPRKTKERSSKTKGKKGSLDKKEGSEEEGDLSSEFAYYIDEVLEEMNKGTSLVTQSNVFQYASDPRDIEDFFLQIIAMGMNVYNPINGERGQTLGLIARPGVGKSEVVKQVADLLGYGFVEFQVEQLFDEATITGLVSPISKEQMLEQELAAYDSLSPDRKLTPEEREEIRKTLESKYPALLVDSLYQSQTRPDWVFSLITEAGKNGGKVVLVIDEALAAIPTIQASLMPVILEKKVADLDLNKVIDDLRIIITTNKPGVVSDVAESALAPFVNRIGMIHIDPPARDDENIKLMGKGMVDEIQGNLIETNFLYLDERKRELERALERGEERRLGNFVKRCVESKYGKEEAAAWINHLRSSIDVNSDEWKRALAISWEEVIDYWISEAGGGLPGKTLFVDASLDEQKRAIVAAEQEGKQFPTLRAIWNAIFMNATCRYYKVAPVVRNALLSGWLGEKTTADFVEYSFSTRLYQKTIQRWLDNPDSFVFRLHTSAKEEGEEDSVAKAWGAKGRPLVGRVGVVAGKIVADYLSKISNAPSAKEKNQLYDELESKMNNFYDIAVKLCQGSYVSSGTTKEAPGEQWKRRDYASQVLSSMFGYLQTFFGVPELSDIVITISDKIKGVNNSSGKSRSAVNLFQRLIQDEALKSLGFKGINSAVKFLSAS